MSVSNQMVHPGLILHEVIVGALRAKGTSLHEWCRENGVGNNTARAATYGQSGGPIGRKIREKLIEDAGRDWVMAAYSKRVLMEAERLRGGVAA